MSKMTDFHVDPNEPAFIFIAEAISLQGLSDPVPIGEHARLVRATGSMRDLLSNILEPHTKTLYSGIVTNPWQSRGVATEHGVAIHPVIDPSQHQYWVVQHWRRMFDRQLELAMELANPGLTPLLSQLRADAYTSGYVNSHAILNWLENNLVSPSQAVGQKEADGIAEVWQKLIDFEDNNDPYFDFIKKALNDFYELKIVSTQRPLHVLGLFAIIEGLLTTNQENTTGNSLTHQIKEKLTLFGNRFPEPIDFAVHLPGTSAMQFEKVVTKLYKYRSAVAHGSKVEFTTGDLQVLQSHELVCAYLRVLVRKLILQALHEPALFRDMKRC